MPLALLDVPLGTALPAMLTISMLDYWLAMLSKNGSKVAIVSIHLNVDFPGRKSAGMTAMRAANILNQVPSIKGKVTQG